MRQPTAPTTERVQTSQSFWLGKSREELSREAAARAEEMSNTKVGRSLVARFSDL